MTTEEKFEKMTEEFITEMSGVKCSLEDFRSGLKAACDTLKERVAQVTEELGE